MSQGSCYSTDPRDFLRDDNFLKDTPQFMTKDQLSELTNTQLEQVAEALGVDTGEVTKKTGKAGQGGPRHGQLVDLLHAMQEQYSTALQQAAREAVLLDEMSKRVVGRAEVMMENVGDGEVEATQQLDSQPPPEHRASQATLQKFADRLVDLRIETRAQKARGRRIRKQLTKEMNELWDDPTLTDRQKRERSAEIARRKQTEYITTRLKDSMTNDEIDELHEHLTHHPITARVPTMRWVGADVVLSRLIGAGILPYESDIKFFGRVFGQQVESALKETQSTYDRSLMILNELWNTPRTVITSYDISATARQGLPGLITHPVQTSRSMSQQLQAFASEEAAQQWNEHHLRSSPSLQEGISRFGVYWAPLDQILAQSSEQVESLVGQGHQRLLNASLIGWGRVLEPLKWFARGTRSSERAWITFLNSQRKWMWEGLYSELRAEGYHPDINPEVFKEVAQFVNAATGRGNFRSLSNPILNGIFFSPRFVASRFEHIGRSFKAAANPNAPRGLKKEAFRQVFGLASFWGSLALMAGFAAHAMGWDSDDEEEGFRVGMNPFDGDFLKFQIGNTRIDVGGGYGQIIRTMMRLSSGLGSIRSGPFKLDERTGELVRTEGVSDPESFWRTLTRDLLRFKLQPTLGSIAAIGDGRQIGSGEKVTPSRLVSGLVLPITAQEVEPIVQEHGAWGLQLLIPEVLGFGTTVFDDHPNPGFFGGGRYVDLALGKALYDDPYAMIDPQGR